MHGMFSNFAEMFDMQLMGKTLICTILNQQNYELQC